MKNKLIKIKNLEEFNERDRVCVKHLINNVNLGYKEWKEGEEVYGIILEKRKSDYDIELLIEFDEYIGGHDGNHYGRKKGKDGHCWWIDESSMGYVNYYKVIKTNISHNLY